MNKTANVRCLTKDENKQLKENWEITGFEFAAPFLGWQNKNLNSKIFFFDVDENTIIDAPLTRYVTLQTGIFIAVLTSDCERIFSFDKTEYTEALDFYNKMVEALKNNNI